MKSTIRSDVVVEDEGSDVTDVAEEGEEADGEDVEEEVDETDGEDVAEEVEEAGVAGVVDVAEEADVVDVAGADAVDEAEEGDAGGFGEDFRGFRLYLQFVLDLQPRLESQSLQLQPEYHTQKEQKQLQGGDRCDCNVLIGSVPFCLMICIFYRYSAFDLINSSKG